MFYLYIKYFIILKYIIKVHIKQIYIAVINLNY